MASPYSDDHEDDDRSLVINTDIIRDKSGDSQASDNRKRKTPDSHTEVPKKAPKAGERKCVELKKTAEIFGGDIGMSGSAWARALRDSQPVDVQVEHEHEYSRGALSKVPSIVAYRADNPHHPDFEDTQEAKFGFEVDGSMTSKSFFKMCLDLKVPNPEFDDQIFEHSISRFLVPGRADADGYTTLVNYMSWFYKTQISRTERTQGPDYLQNRKLLIVLTHPAACSDSGKSRLVEAAKKAGWDSRPGSTMKICSEAEAAALAVFVARRTRAGSEAWEREFQNGTGVMVLDHGALTVDCATFQVTKKRPMLQIKGCAISEGGKCGTTALYCRLYKYLRGEIGSVFDSLDHTIIGSRGTLLESLERILMSFTGQDLAKKHRLKLELPAGARHLEYDRNTKEFNISGHTLKELMDANLVYIKRIIDNQFESAHSFGVQIKTVIHSGGGSRCRYFHDQVAEYCRGYNSITLGAEMPQEVVCKGAVIYGLQQHILESRKSRAAFGVSVIRDAKLVMHWFNRRGQDFATVDRKSQETIKGQVEMRLQDLLAGTPKCFIDLYGYDADADEPPANPADPNVRKIGRIQMQPNNVSTRTRNILLKEYKNDMEALVEVTAAQTINGTGELEFEVRAKGCLLGKKPLSYDFGEGQT